MTQVMVIEFNNGTKPSATIVPKGASPYEVARKGINHPDVHKIHLANIFTTIHRNGGDNDGE